MSKAHSGTLAPSQSSIHRGERSGLLLLFVSLGVHKQLVQLRCRDEADESVRNRLSCVSLHPMESQERGDVKGELVGTEDVQELVSLFHVLWALEEPMLDAVDNIGAVITFVRVVSLADSVQALVGGGVVHAESRDRHLDPAGDARSTILGRRRF